MAQEPSAPVATCPPHHWLIERDDHGRDRWACQRCGLVRATERRSPEGRRLSNVSTWGRDEVALLDID